MKKILFLLGFAFASPSFAYAPQMNYIEAVRNADLYSSKYKDIFASTLANEYKSYALYKANFTPDIINANHFAAKALNAHYGERVKPDNIYTKSLPERNIVLISNYYDDLNYLLTTDLINKYPQLMAEAQVKFDCWIDSEANGLSPAQSQKCLSRFKKARQYLFDKLNPECENCKKELAEEKAKPIRKFDGTTLPIPRWPNMPLVKNTPPIPVLKHTVIRTDKPITINSDNINNSLKASLAEIEGMVATINNQPKIVIDDKGAETILVPKADSATTSDIATLKLAVDELKQQITELQNTKPEIIQNNDGLDELKNQLSDLNYKIDELANREPVLEKIDQDDYIETEVLSAPSDLLPFEIFFDWNKSNVDYKFLPQLKDISEKALSSKEMIIIQGHTDTSGSPKYNEDLSDDRANSVAKILIKNGIPEEKIILQALGSTDLKVQTKPGVKKPENRRVVIK